MKIFFIGIRLLFSVFVFTNSYPIVISTVAVDCAEVAGSGLTADGSVDSAEQYFLLRNLYTIFNFLKVDEASTHTSLVLAEDSLEMKAKYLDKDLDGVASKMAKQLDIDWLKKIDNRMQVSFGSDFKKWQYYEVFKSIYLNKFSWKGKATLVYDLVLDRGNPHGLLSDFLREFETFYKIGSSKTQIRWHLTEKHDYKLLVFFYHIIKVCDYSKKVLIACKFKNLDIRFYLDPALNGVCVGYFKEEIGRRMFDLDHTSSGIMNMNFYKKIYAQAIKSLDIDLIGYDFR
ncbi:MAG: hypothetical protein WC192_02305 [Candidatus Babeliales bacterium]|jgi:hypothetical protein